MRLQLSKSKNATSLYIIESIYTKEKKRTSRVVKKLGTLAELSKVHTDPIAWAKQLAKQMTQEENDHNQPIQLSYYPAKQMPENRTVLFNGGYLFLQKIYHKLGLEEICRHMQKQCRVNYDLNEILKVLVFGRILFPKSKLATFKEAKQLLEHPAFALHDLYRALEVLARQMDTMQSQLYLNSKKVLKRNDHILFYDCTNFFFEVEEETGLKQYGMSKEHRPNPIVQLGLFLDGDGIPLAFSLHPGNTNEQTTLKPLEKQIILDFQHAHFVVVTDAGLASTANRQFNNLRGRYFITVQSLKKMKAFQKEWALDPKGWKLAHSEQEYNLAEIEADEEKRQRFADQIFYKERWMNEGGLEQRYIVTFSFSYKAYQETVRQRQLTRAVNLMDTGRFQQKRSTDPRRFVDQLYFDEDGVICDHSTTVLNETRIYEEASYDGYYCVATNLEAEARLILKANRQRWEIEESFRLLKSELKARPVYLSREDRITAHFLTCFLALYLFRMLEKKLGDTYTAPEILKTLREMNFMEVDHSYIPGYVRTPITDQLHDTFGFRTDYEIIKMSDMRKIIKKTKKSIES